MKTIAVFWDSPMPSQRMLRGIQVIDGRGRSRETKGSMMALDGRQREPQEHAPRGGDDRLPEFAGADQLARLRRDRAWRGQEDRRDPTILGGGAPERQERADGEDLDQQAQPD